VTRASSVGYEKPIKEARLITARRLGARTGAWEEIPHWVTELSVPELVEKYGAVVVSKSNCEGFALSVLVYDDYIE